MKKKNQKLKLGKETISSLQNEKILGGALGYSNPDQRSCSDTCFVKSCGCPNSVNGKCKK